MTSIFLRICIGLFLIFTAFLPSACSQKASTIMGYKQGTEIAIPTETQLLNHPSLPTITRMPTKSPAHVSKVSQTSQSTTQTTKNFHKPTIAAAQACPAWVYQKQEYSQDQWRNMPSPRTPGDYIGFQYRFLPMPLEYIGETMIGNSDYGIAWVRDENIEILWLVKLICRYWDEAYDEIIDTLELPVISQSDMLAFGQGECQLNGIYDPELVIIAKREITGRLTDIKKAWRANRRAERFEVLPTTGIDCVVVISE